ncbi:MAG TPA: hypothetical protein VGI28_03985, partial [Stellaceae bacterium]
MRPRNWGNPAGVSPLLYQILKPGCDQGLEGGQPIVDRPPVIAIIWGLEWQRAALPRPAKEDVDWFMGPAET